MIKAAPCPAHEYARVSPHPAALRQRLGTAGRSRRPSTSRKIIMLGRDRQKAETVETRDRLNGDSPIGPVPGDSRRPRIMRARLIGIADWLGAAQNAIDEHASAGPAFRFTIKIAGQGDGARRPLGRVDVRSERRANRLGQRSGAGRHGGDLLFDKRENGAQRRQPHTSLNWNRLPSQL